MQASLPTPMLPIRMVSRPECCKYSERINFKPNSTEYQNELFCSCSFIRLATALVPMIHRMQHQTVQNQVMHNQATHNPATHNPAIVHMVALNLAMLNSPAHSAVFQIMPTLRSFQVDILAAFLANMIQTLNKPSSITITIKN